MNMITNELAEWKCREFLKKGFRVNDDGTIKSNTGKIVARYNKDGYVLISTNINNETVSLRAHHLVFYNTHGYVPEQINHIDWNRENNKIDNLEPSNASDNAKYKEVKGKCYYWQNKKQSWQVRRCFNMKHYNICLTKDEEVAKRLGEELRNLNTLDEILEFKKKHKKYKV